MTEKSYTSDDISVLTDREHCRLRTAVYLGDTTENTYVVPIISESGFTTDSFTFIPAVYKAIGEVIDNSLDEFSHLSNQRSKTLNITTDPDKGTYTIVDNGRGVPIDKHTTGKYTPEVVFGSLRSGRNFKSDKAVGVIGQNGVGSSIVNYCSEMFEVDIYRDGKHYQQRFVDGALKASKPKITDKKGTTGTSISFTLDPAVFMNVSIPPALMRNRAMEIAMTNPSVTVKYNGETFKFKNGIADIIKNTETPYGFGEFVVDTDDVHGTVYVLPGSHEDSDERMFTWVNSSFLFDGGRCNTQFINAFMDRAIESVKKVGTAKDGITIAKNDVRAGLTFIADLKMKNPQYDSQAKTRLSGPDLRKEMVAAVDVGWKSFSKSCAEWIRHCYEAAYEKHNHAASRDLTKEHARNKGKKLRIENLMDATSRVRSECKLFIVEGESARAQISDVRDPQTMGAFALTGKINNVYGSSPVQVLKMDKIKDLLLAMGLTPGRPASRSSMNFGQIIISTDADYDGGDIFTILVNLLHQFWPELFDPKYEPVIYRLVAPNVCLTKGNSRVHFPTRDQYEANKHKYKDKGWSVNYFKGLGSMSSEDWTMILFGETDAMIPIIDDGKMDGTLELLFGPDSDKRKQWLQTETN